MEKYLFFDENSRFCPKFRRFSFEKPAFLLKITADWESASKTELGYVCFWNVFEFSFFQIKFHMKKIDHSDSCWGAETSMKGRRTVFHKIGPNRNHCKTNAKLWASEDLITNNHFWKFQLDRPNVSFTTIPTQIHASDTPFEWRPWSNAKFFLDNYLLIYIPFDSEWNFEQNHIRSSTKELSKKLKKIHNILV